MLPKPPRGTLGVVPGRAAGVVVVVVVATRVGLWVAVRVNAGRDQWLLLLVRVHREPELPPPEERPGEQRSAPDTPGTAVDAAAGGQFCCGVMA